MLLRPFLVWEPRLQLGNENPIVALGFDDLYNINGRNYTTIVCNDADEDFAKRLRELNGKRVIIRATIQKAHCVFEERMLLLWFFVRPDSVDDLAVKRYWR
ncbi:MAG: hypothetical protein HZA46_05565 [Planctomycetales bacterium]|nr:hypothetical protein [Planctomycetales bacterium]